MEMVKMQSEAVTIARAMMASIQTRDRVNWWIASLNLSMRLEGSPIGHGIGAYIKKDGEDWLSRAIAEAMMISPQIKRAVNRFVMERKIEKGGFGDDDDMWAASILAKAMAIDPRVRSEVQGWLDARDKKAKELRLDAQRKRAALAKVDPKLREKEQRNWLKQSSRRKTERDASVEFIVMREYRGERSRLLEIERLTIDRSPAFRAHVNRKRFKRSQARASRDACFRLYRACRGRVSSFVKGKSVRTQALVGCPWIEFKNWLQSKFQPGMTWENYGEWEIDHIIPCASFDLTDMDQLHKCFHYSNTQPLWKLENAVKGSRLNGVYYRFQRNVSGYKASLCDM